MEHSNYWKLLLMLFVSFFIMYGVMFLNVDSISHIYFSLTRLYMSLLMVTPMALLMMSMMGKMYPRKTWNIAISIASIAVFFISLWLLRTQTPVSDVQYMKAMIPHHSSAIMTSRNASIRDPEVKKLSESIIASQEQEIDQMKSILQRMDR
ncbi:MAG: DUF305 domain-containing protein [Chitinophagaceae bacterium]|nr:DUF305 domain-containing protein [Chitinophagaceae bacterium]